MSGITFVWTVGDVVGVLFCGGLAGVLLVLGTRHLGLRVRCAVSGHRWLLSEQKRLNPSMTARVIGRHVCTRCRAEEVRR